MQRDRFDVNLKTRLKKAVLLHLDQAGVGDLLGGRVDPEQKAACKSTTLIRVPPYVCCCPEPVLVNDRLLDGAVNSEKQKVSDGF